MLNAAAKVSLHPAQIGDIDQLLHAQDGEAKVLAYLTERGLRHLWDQFSQLKCGSLVGFEGGRISQFQAPGVVYNTYTLSNRKGVDIIHADGSYCGWSFSDWLIFRGVLLGVTYLRYEFDTVGTLSEDYRRGTFNQALCKAEDLYKAKYKHVKPHG